MMHILHVLTVGFNHIHSASALWHFYTTHRAITFLRSGVTSESPATQNQAVALLHWLLSQHIAPVDW